MVKKHLQVFLHLDGVVVHLGHREDAHFTLPPHLQRQYQLLVIHTQLSSKGNQVISLMLNHLNFFIFLFYSIGDWQPLLCKQTV